MRNKKKKNRFSDLMVGEGSDTDRPEGAPVFKEIAAGAADGEESADGAVKISFIARLKKAIQSVLENLAQKREARRKAREQRAIEAAQRVAEAEKPAEFPAEIAMNAAPEGKKAVPAEPAAELPSESHDERPQVGLAAGAWKMLAGTPGRKWISAGIAAAGLLAVLGFFIAGMFSGTGDESGTEIAKNTPETQKSEASAADTKPTKSVKPTSPPVKEKTPLPGENPQKSSLNDTFSAFSDPPPLDIPGFPEDVPPPSESMTDPYDPRHASGLSPEILPETGGFPDFPGTPASTPAGLTAELPTLDNFPAVASVEDIPRASPFATASENTSKPASSAPSAGSLEEPEFIPLSSLPRATDILDNAPKKNTLAETLADSPVISAENILAPAGFAPESEFLRNNNRETPPSAAVSAAPGHFSSPATAKPAENAGNYALQANRANHANGGGISKDTAYVIQPGDDFSEISRKVYGTGSYARAIAVYNNMDYTDRRVAAGGLPTGKKLFIPQTAFLQKHYPSLCPAAGGVGDSRPVLADARPEPAAAVPAKTEYVTRAGDNLPDIAEHALGSASRWAEIYQLNREVLAEPFRAIAPGTRLQLPGETAVMATRPGDGAGGRY